MKQSEHGVLWGVCLEYFHLRQYVCSLALVAFVASGCAAKQDQSLVITAEQFDEIAAAGPDDEPPLRGIVERGAPAIIVEKPDPDTGVRTPFQVQMRFRPIDDATIDLDTLKIKYGWFDLTEEVLKRMIVSTSGIEGQIDAIKPGKYKLKFSISDDKQRTGRTTLTFHVIK
jgi:hypothetical protein